MDRLLWLQLLLALVGGFAAWLIIRWGEWMIRDGRRAVSTSSPSWRPAVWVSKYASPAGAIQLSTISRVGEIQMDGRPRGFSVVAGQEIIRVEEPRGCGELGKSPLKVLQAERDRLLRDLELAAGGGR